MLLYLGRVHDARWIAAGMIDLPRHPLYNMLEALKKMKRIRTSRTTKGPLSRRADRARTSAAVAFSTLRQYEYWDDLIEACRSGSVELAGTPEEQGDVHVNLGIAHYRRGDLAKGDGELSSLRRLVEDERSKRETALADARNKPRSRAARPRRRHAAVRRPSRAHDGEPSGFGIVSPGGRRFLPQSHDARHLSWAGCGVRGGDRADPQAPDLGRRHDSPAGPGRRGLADPRVSCACQSSVRCEGRRSRLSFAAAACGGGR